VRCLLGLALIAQTLAALVEQGYVVWKLVWIVAGLLLLSSGLRTVIWVENNAGRRVDLPILIFERRRADRLVAEVNDALSRLVDN
jgi:hypothetical protein